MDQTNLTRITTIHLFGFRIPHEVKWLVFIVLLVVYCVTICGNLLIITLVSYSRSLHSPMYFFLSQLSLLDILLITDILPNTLGSVLVENVVPISQCLAQFYFFVIAESSECLLLTVMSWDRYLAICRPLHYTMEMNSRVCWTLIIISWTLGILLATIYNLSLIHLNFCGPDVIDHFFCDLEPILQLSCSDTIAAQLEETISGVTFVVIPFILIIVSYAYIISAIFKIQSITGRQKVFSTCSSHLTVVSIYYGTLVCVYLMPNRGQTKTITKLLSLLYTVVTPMMNPIIYSLRNTQLKEALGKLI